MGKSFNTVEPVRQNFKSATVIGSHATLITRITRRVPEMRRKLGLSTIVRRENLRDTKESGYVFDDFAFAARIRLHRVHRVHFCKS